jgi:hypothetical protein
MAHKSVIKNKLNEIKIGVSRNDEVWENDESACWKIKILLNTISRHALQNHQNSSLSETMKSVIVFSVT